MMRRAYTAFVATGMFFVRMVVLGLMALLQLTVGGAEIRAPATDHASAD